MVKVRKSIRSASQKKVIQKPLVPHIVADDSDEESTNLNVTVEVQALEGKAIALKPSSLGVEGAANLNVSVELHAVESEVQPGETQSQTIITQMSLPPALTTRARTSRQQRSATRKPPANASATGNDDANFFDSSIGKFLMDIGEGLARETADKARLRTLKNSLSKCDDQKKPSVEKNIEELKVQVKEVVTKNAPFKFKSKKCEFCEFSSESQLVMAMHYETPHMVGCMYKCNYCTFRKRSFVAMKTHMLTEHNVVARLEKAPSRNQCPNCPYDDTGRIRLERHIPGCLKRFCPDINQAPPDDWHPPA